MTQEDWIALGIVFVCLLLSAFFSASETALTASSRAAMTRLEKNGNRRAQIVNSLLATRERLLGAILFSNNAVNIAASSLTTGILLSWFGDVGVVYATIIMTVVIVVFSEIIPKTAAFNAPDRSALLVARPMQFVVGLFGPMLMAVEAFARWVLRCFGMKVGAESADPVCRTRNCAARSISCMRRAASKSSIATWSAASSICARSKSPT